ncbi:MAG: HD domain-containing protein [Kiritimatiellales bacterium]
MDTVYTTALKILNTIRTAGFAALFAGGSVRDMLLGRPAKDYDIATDALPEQIEALFPRTVAVGKAFGVIIVVENGIEIEVTTFRADGGYQDGRRPGSIKFSGAEEDAQRRDFTINGMFYDPAENEVIDFTGGRADLKNKLVRAIGEPDRRFAEDHLRMLRAVRFAFTLGFDIETETRATIIRHAPALAKISPERIENEFSRTLTESPNPGDALRELVELGLIKFIIPEILPLIGQEQPPEFHPEGDVFEHTVLMLNMMPEHPARELAYAVLLHDVGKPATAFKTDRWRFHNHEHVSAGMAEEILRRLRLPAKEIRHIVIAIDRHMRFKDVQNMNRSTLRKLIGAETFELELELHRLDCASSHRMLGNYEFLRRERDNFKAEPVLPPRWITGADLIARGIPPGPAMGALLKKAYDAQLEGTFANKAELLEWLKK